MCLAFGHMGKHNSDHSPKARMRGTGQQDAMQLVAHQQLYLQ